MNFVSRDLFEDWYTKEYDAVQNVPTFGALRKEVSLFIEKLPHSKGNALDIGCGDGRNSIALAKQGLDVTGIDLIPEHIIRDKAKANSVTIKYIRQNALAYEGPANHFDVVICSEVLHLLTKEEIVLIFNKINQITKSGSLIFLDILSDIKRWFEDSKKPFGWDKEARVSVEETETLYKQEFPDWDILNLEHFFDKQTWPLTNAHDLPIPQYTWQGTYVSCVAIKR